MIRNALEAARQLDTLGWNVLPAPEGGKAPTVNWRKFQDQRTSSKLRLWFGTDAVNIFIMTGSVSQLLVLDADSEGAEAFWRDLIGDAMDATTTATTRKGHHYYFSLEPGQVVRSWSHHKGPIQFDVRAEGSGVVAPPSVHESGHVYTWVRGPEHIQPVPKVLLSAADAGLENRPDPGAGGNAPRSMLSHLLSNPAGEGGRNNWLTQVCGHYAKMFRSQQDTYLVQARMAAALLSPPLDDQESERTIQSVWDAEQRNHREEAEQRAANMRPTPDNGYLVMTGERILCQTRIKEESGFEYGLEEWGNFGIRAVGVMEEPDNRSYDVEITRPGAEPHRRLLPVKVLSRTDALATWLSQSAATVVPPTTMYPKEGTMGARLQRLLESQDPPRFEVADCLGWDGDGFLCHEGVITAEGLKPFGLRRPHPQLTNWAPWHYGFDVDPVELRAMLRELLTFHDEEVCSVFGAWWTACLLKPQIQSRTSLFPFMALEAPSEAGKTTGFFSLMLRLGGSQLGQVDPTRASLRDYISAHQSGIVWVDDLSETVHLQDLLRQATGEGSVSKKGEDNTTTEVVRLVAPVCLSGEGLQLNSQKALLDRAVMLEVPSPTQRRSQHDPSRRQWDDIVAFRERYPDLSRASGTLVAQVLQLSGMLDDLRSLVPDAWGRWGDKIAVVRLGARILSALTGTEEHTARVDEWATRQRNPGTDNTLTLQLLPAVLSRTGWPHNPMPAVGRWPPTPAVVVDGIVWFSPRFLADWWYEIRHGRIEPRVESAEAIAQQAWAAGSGRAKRAMRITGTGQSPVYWALSRAASEAVLNRSRGQEIRRMGSTVPLQLEVSHDA